MNNLFSVENRDIYLLFIHIDYEDQVYQTLAMAKIFKRQYPHCKVLFLGNASFQDLAENCIWVDQFLAYRHGSSLLGFARLIYQLKAFSYELLYSHRSHIRHIFLRWSLRVDIKHILVHPRKTFSWNWESLPIDFKNKLKPHFFLQKPYIFEFSSTPHLKDYLDRVWQKYESIFRGCPFILSDESFQTSKEGSFHLAVCKDPHQYFQSIPEKLEHISPYLLQKDKFIITLPNDFSKQDYLLFYALLAQKASFLMGVKEPICSLKRFFPHKASH
jgi:hypothetical protein